MPRRFCYMPSNHFYSYQSIRYYVRVYQIIILALPSIPPTPYPHLSLTDTHIQLHLLRSSVRKHGVLWLYVRNFYFTLNFKGLFSLESPNILNFKLLILVPKAQFKVSFLIYNPVHRKKNILKCTAKAQLHSPITLLHVAIAYKMVNIWASARQNLQ